MTTPATFTIASSGLTAEIAAKGAELVRLRDEAGRDLQWDGDPAFWSGRAPLLFPIVGRLKDDSLTVAGRSYPMKQHGIARLGTFACVEQEPEMVRLRLESSEATKQAFPFDFVLEATYAVRDATLRIGVMVHNPGTVPLPCSMGFHPAFRWPLPYGADRAAHEITFEADEPAPIRRVVGGLLSPEAVPSPLDGRTLPLADDLFTHDALIWTGLASRAVRYGPPGGRCLEVRFPLMPDLGIWTRPGAGFVCIEPWAGHASPEGFDGEFSDKPGLIQVAPGGVHAFGLSVALDPP